MVGEPWLQEPEIVGHVASAGSEHSWVCRSQYVPQCWLGRMRQGRAGVGMRGSETRLTEKVMLKPRLWGIKVSGCSLPDPRRNRGRAWKEGH